MKIAVLSGKGGAGKTFVSVNLSNVIENSVYADCDVEEPNGKIFFNPDQTDEIKVYTQVPKFDLNKCVSCRKCVDACNFSALVFIKKKPKVFPDVCHNCGLCRMICPANAVSEENKEVGKCEISICGNKKTVGGTLNLGQASAVPVINEVLKMTRNDENVVIDCPPGSSCSVMASIANADFCLICAEPTAFGFHNFKMVYTLTKLLCKKSAVVINKEEELYKPIYDYLQENNLPLIMKIPYDKEIAGSVSKGEKITDTNPLYREKFVKLYEEIGRMV